MKRITPTTILTHPGIERINEESLPVLAQTGVQVDDEDVVVVGLPREHGCSVVDGARVTDAGVKKLGGTLPTVRITHETTCGEEKTSWGLKPTNLTTTGTSGPSIQSTPGPRHSIVGCYGRACTR